jgi:hypothetical protein
MSEGLTLGVLMCNIQNYFPIHFAVCRSLKLRVQDSFAFIAIQGTVFTKARQ